MFAMMAPGMLDGVLPLHFAGRLSQSQIGGAYAATALLIAVAAMVAARLRPVAAMACGGVAIIAGITLAGTTGSLPAWLLALAVIGLGCGATETGATGALLEAVPTERIVTAMVVWSQIGMVGYLLAPGVGAPLAQAFGFGSVAAVPLAAAAVLFAVGVFARRGSRTGDRR
jgi:MFS family permease